MPRACRSRKQPGRIISSAAPSLVQPYDVRGKRVRCTFDYRVDGLTWPSVDASAGVPQLTVASFRFWNEKRFAPTQPRIGGGWVSPRSWRRRWSSRPLAPATSRSVPSS